MFFTTRRTLGTGESSEPLSTVVDRRASIAGAPLASEAAAASVNATRCSAAGWATTITAHAVIKIIANSTNGNFTMESPLDEPFDWSPHLRPDYVRRGIISDSQIRFSACWARVFDFFSLVFSSPPPPTLIRKKPSFLNTYKHPPTPPPSPTPS